MLRMKIGPKLSQLSPLPIPEGFYTFVRFRGLREPSPHASRSSVAERRVWGWGLRALSYI